MTMLLRDVSIRGTQTQDRTVAAPDRKRVLLRRYGPWALAGLAVMVLGFWSVRS